jgi:hypothetical protein
MCRYSYIRGFSLVLGDFNAGASVIKVKDEKYLIMLYKFPTIFGKEKEGC